MFFIASFFGEAGSVKVNARLCLCNSESIRLVDISITVEVYQTLFAKGSWIFTMMGYLSTQLHNNFVQVVILFKMSCVTMIDAGKSLTDNFISRISYHVVGKLYRQIKSDNYICCGFHKIDISRLPLFMKFVGWSKGHFLF